MTPEDKIQKLITEVTLLKQNYAELTQSLLNVESLAGKREPYRYTIDITIDQGATAIQEGTVQTSRAGPFLCERILATFRIATIIDGSTNVHWPGMYLPLSSRPIYPFLTDFQDAAVVPAVTNPVVMAPPLAFEWTYEVDDDDRQRNDKFAPGDYFAADRDGVGIFACSDIFAAGATIRFKVNPLHAVGNTLPFNHGTNGVLTYEFNAVFEGYKILQPIQV